MIEGFIYKFALRDFLRIRRLWLWALLIGLLGAITLVLGTVPGDQSPSRIYNLVSGMMVFHALALLAAIFSSAIVSAEIEQKTIVYLVTRPVPRWKLLLFRAFAAMTVVAVLSTVALIVVSLCSYKGQFLANPYLFRDLKGIVLGSAVYTGIFTLMSLWLNKPMVASLAYAFGWEIVVPNIPGDLKLSSMYAHLQAIVERPATDLSAVAAQGITPNMSYPTLIGLSAITLGLACYWFSNFEYLPREDGS